MTKQTLAAALNLAYQLAAQDGFQEEETWVLAQEIKSFNLSEEDEEEVLRLYRTLTADQAIELVRNSDEATKDEVNALMMMAMINDRVIDPNESRAFFRVRELCGITREMSIDDARRVLGF